MIDMVTTAKYKVSHYMLLFKSPPILKYKRIDIITIKIKNKIFKNSLLV